MGAPSGAQHEIALTWYPHCATFNRLPVHVVAVARRGDQLAAREERDDTDIIAEKRIHGRPQHQPPQPERTFEQAQPPYGSDAGCCPPIPTRMSTSGSCS